MTLLDRLKSQPRQASLDLATRLAQVHELPLDAREAIASFARSDEDARVRKAAVGKLMDPATLGLVVSSDSDASVRAAAVDMLRDFALERFEGAAEAEALAAIDAVGDAKLQAQLGRAAPRESVALRAVAAIVKGGGDVHALGSMARHAVVDAARHAAFEVLRQRDAREELLAVAANSDFKDTSLSALELFSERAALEHVAERGRNKAAAKRARSMMRAADEEAARAAREAAIEALHPAAEAMIAVAVEAEASVEPVEAGPTAAPSVSDATTPVTASPDAESAVETQGSSQDAPLSPAESERRLARLLELGEEAQAASSDADLASARRRLTLVRREWKDLAHSVAVDPVLGERIAHAESVVASRIAEAKESSARARQEALERFGQLLDRVEALVASDDVSLKAADSALREVRAALGNMPQLPTKQDYDGVLARLKTVQGALSEKTRAMREALDWKRWSNVAVQERLCEAMEALASVEDTALLPKRVRDLQAEWRTAADAPPAKSRALWQRFKTAHDVIWARCEAYFAEQADVRNANVSKKTSLCERAEALSASTDWIRTAEAIKALQAEWKEVGPTPRGGDKALWERFHAACDAFYRRRHDDLAARKAIWAENLAKKEALCAKAEALASSTAWEESAAAIKQLQAEWKTIGPVKKTRSEAIWQRFHGACNRFFEAYAHRHDAARAERLQARTAVCETIEALAQTGSTEGSSSDFAASVRRALDAWAAESAHRLDPTQARPLEARFTAALDALLTTRAEALAGTDLDPCSNQQRLEAIVSTLETLARSLSGAGAAQVDQSLSPTARLASMLKEALASNTIGGKVDDDSRWRAAADEVEQARAKWMRIGPVPHEVRRALDDRFARASRTITERVTARLGAPRRSASDTARRVQHPGAKGAQPARKAPPRMAAGGGQERSRS